MEVEMEVEAQNNVENTTSSNDGVESPNEVEISDPNGFESPETTDPNGVESQNEIEILDNETSDLKVKKGRSKKAREEAKPYKQKRRNSAIMTDVHPRFAKDIIAIFNTYLNDEFLKDHAQEYVKETNHFDKKVDDELFRIITIRDDGSVSVNDKFFIGLLTKIVKQLPFVDYKIRDKSTNEIKPVKIRKANAHLYKILFYDCTWVLDSKCVIKFRSKIYVTNKLNEHQEKLLEFWDDVIAQNLDPIKAMDDLFNFNMTD